MVTLKCHAKTLYDYTRNKWAFSKNYVIYCLKLQKENFVDENTLHLKMPCETGNC